MEVYFEKICCRWNTTLLLRQAEGQLRPQSSASATWAMSVRNGSLPPVACRGRPREGCAWPPVGLPRVTRAEGL